MMNKPLKIKPSRKRSNDDDCGCGKSLKRNNPRLKKNARVLKKRI